MRHGRPTSLQMRLDAGRIVGARKVQPGREPMRQRHADGDALAMHQPRAVIGGRGFQRVAEGVAEIEQRAVAGLELVARRRRRPWRGRIRAIASVRAGPPRKDLAPVLLQPGEELRPVDQAVFGDLGIAGAEFAQRAACRARRCRPAPASADGTRRSGSCRARLLMPVLPPTEESTWASSEVGICTKFMPRRTMPAAKPVRSPMTPPPSAITASPRSSRAARTLVDHRLQRIEALRLLAGRQRDRRRARSPAAFRLSTSGSRWAAATFSSVTIARARLGRRWRISSAPARDQPRADQDVVGAVAEPDFDRYNCAFAHS